MPNMENLNNDGPKKIPRRDFIKTFVTAVAGLAIAPEMALSNTTKEQQEGNRTVESSEMVRMVRKEKKDPNNPSNSPENMVEVEDSNLSEGFSRMKINLKFTGENEIIGAGSFFSLEDPNKAKAEFISNTKHPEFFQNGVNFDAIQKYYEQKNKKITVVVAGAYYAPNTKKVEGVALEDGVMVGQDTVKSGSNGLLVIENGNPEIQFVNQISDMDQYVKELQNKKADMFQQTSYIRPGGSFSSSSPNKWELRFFVEGEYNGVAKKGILNFSEDMTYTEAVETMTKMKGFKISKAIGLDTGDMSEGYFYDKNGAKYLMIEENSGNHRDEYTNVLVFYSQE